MGIKLLVVGQLSSPANIGAWLINASKELELDVEGFDISFNTYAPSMGNLLGRAFYKIAGKRPLEWWQLGHKLTEKVNRFHPHILISTGVVPLPNVFFKECQKLGVKTVNFLTDNPFSKGLYCKGYLENLSQYDLIASTKSGIVNDLRDCRAKKIKFLPFAYDPNWHRLPDPITDTEKAKFTSDISFIGTGDKERLIWLDPFSTIENIDLKLFGSNWDAIKVSRWGKNPVVVGNDFRLAISLSKISLGLLRKSRQDVSTQRTFEIAPCGGCGIYEDTEEHQKLLKGYPDHGFFSTPEDLVNKCKWLLDNPTEREKMRQTGIKIIANPENTFAARLESIIKLLNTSEERK